MLFILQHRLHILHIRLQIIEIYKIEPLYLIFSLCIIGALLIIVITEEEDKILQPKSKSKFLNFEHYPY